LLLHGIDRASSIYKSATGRIVTTNNEEQVRNVAAMIVRYLKNHPHAADTAEGITRWWVMRQRYEDSIQTVQKALELLVEDGVLQGHSLTRGSVIYSLKSISHSDA
jgi:Fe2+ or Zn2+ uptake regulation protein